MMMMMMMMMMMLMIMNSFCGMVDRREVFSFISKKDHCQRSSLSRISDTPHAGFKPAQNRKFRLCRIKTCISDNHYTTVPRTYPMLDLLIVHLTVLGLREWNDTVHFARCLCYFENLWETYFQNILLMSATTTKIMSK